MSNVLITVIGPTAIGKTALSIKLAQQFKTEILSADSRQFFKEMSIGTAVPSVAELAAARHHFIKHISIEDEYSVGHYERDALAKLDQLFTAHEQLVLVGGSGLYVDAVIKGLDYFPDVKKGTREHLEELQKTEGNTALQEMLKKLDPSYYKEVDIHNTQRVMRALEVCVSSGNTFSSYRNKPKTPRNFESIKIGLTAGRAIIYDRINRRVDTMMEEGLLEEVEVLLSRKHKNALQTVGYRELFEHLEGEVSLDQAVEKIKTNTRRFAKRQLTWFKKDHSTKWFDYNTPPSVIIDHIKKMHS
jgi:tRNA dimethylallyltransferase